MYSAITKEHNNCNVFKFRKNADFDEYTQGQFEDICGELLSNEGSDLIYFFEASDFDYFFLCGEDYKNQGILNFFQEKQLVIEDSEITYELMSSNFFTSEDVQKLSRDVNQFTVEDEFADFDSKFCKMMKPYVWYAEFQFLS